MAFFALLEFKSDGYGVGEGKVSVGVVDEAAFFVEAKITESECFCSSLFGWDVCSEILTGAHGKEYCAIAQL